MINPVCTGCISTLKPASIGSDLQRVRFPPGSLVAPSGSYRSGGGGNEAVEAFETTGRFGGSASRQAATRVNAVQAPKQPDVGADPVAIRGRPPSWSQEGTTPRDATGSRVPPGYWRW